jgi:hypothetical protein
MGSIAHLDAGWSSLVARRAHNPKVVGSNPAPATNLADGPETLSLLAVFPGFLHFWSMVFSLAAMAWCRPDRFKDQALIPSLF